MNDVEKILEERGATYGDFKDVAKISQRLKDSLHSAPCWRKLPPMVKEGMEMMCVKMARIACSDDIHEDTFKDLIGYPMLMARILENNDA